MCKNFTVNAEDEDIYLYNNFDYIKWQTNIFVTIYNLTIVFIDYLS